MEEGASGRATGGDEILHDSVLAVDRDRAATGELAHRDPVALSVEAQLDPVMDEPFPLQPVGEARGAEDVDGSLLEHPGPDARDHVLLGAVLEHD